MYIARGLCKLTTRRRVAELTYHSTQHASRTRGNVKQSARQRATQNTKHSWEHVHIGLGAGTRMDGRTNSHTIVHTFTHTTARNMCMYRYSVAHGAYRENCARYAKDNSLGLQLLGEFGKPQTEEIVWDHALGCAVSFLFSLHDGDGVLGIQGPNVWSERAFV